MNPDALAATDGPTCRRRTNLGARLAPRKAMPWRATLAWTNLPNLFAGKVCRGRTGR